jgi:C1A family cysteine protease
MSRLLAASVATASLVAGANLQDRPFYEAKFYDWIQTHKIDIKNGDQFAHMLANFANNDDIIERHNAKKLSYTLGHNKFSGMSNEEWIAYVRVGLDMPNKEKAPFTHVAPKDVSALPTSVDWTQTAGIVTPVKDQGNCGSCWSFSATGALEGAYAQKYSQTSSWTGFSEQELVSCNTKTDHGCNGGLMDRAFSYVERNNGLCSEADYPYTSGTTGENGECLDSTCTIDTKLNIASHTDVQTNSDSALMSALVQQPVSVAIQANQPDFQLYKSGVLTGTCGANLDHGVLAVGYGTWTDGTDYYKVKNSWSADWGMSGYVLIERGGNQNNGKGQCGILSGPPSFPNMA